MGDRGELLRGMFVPGWDTSGDNGSALQPLLALQLLRPAIVLSPKFAEIGAFACRYSLPTEPQTHPT